MKIKLCLVEGCTKAVVNRRRCAKHYKELCRKEKRARNLALEQEEVPRAKTVMGLRDPNGRDLGNLARDLKVGMHLNIAGKRLGKVLAVDDKMVLIDVESLDGLSEFWFKIADLELIKLEKESK